MLRAGLVADVVVFDPDTVIDKSTFDPHYFLGVTDVVVNGTPVLRDGAMTGKLPGEIDPRSRLSQVKSQSLKVAKSQRGLRQHLFETLRL
jgi:N-acyl-D-aspartate/D-glutamate deacylase